MLLTDVRFLRNFKKILRISYDDKHLSPRCLKNGKKINRMHFILLVPIKNLLQYASLLDKSPFKVNTEAYFGRIEVLFLRQNSFENLLDFYRDKFKTNYCRYLEFKQRKVTNYLIKIPINIVRNERENLFLNTIQGVIVPHKK